MRSGTFPAALLFAALGLVLVFAPRRARVSSSLALIASLAAALLLPVPERWLDLVFFGCWASVVATAAPVFFSATLRPGVATALSLNAGFWAGVVSSLSGSQLDLLYTLPCVFIWLPASLVVSRHGSLPVKVASSWIVVIAVLAATLQLLPVTPGYLPDHLE
jgi:hypothetical protein